MVNFNDPTPLALFGWSPLDERLVALEEGTFCYLTGNPGTARSLMAAQFLLAGRGPHVSVWINLSGGMPKLSTRIAEHWQSAVNSGKLRVNSAEHPGMETAQVLDRVEELLDNEAPRRVVLFNADLLTSPEDYGAWTRLVGLCKGRNITTLAVGTMAHMGIEIDLSPPALSALSDVLLVSRLYLGTSGRAMSVSVIKPILADGKTDHTFFYRITPEGLQTDESSQRAQATALEGRIRPEARSGNGFKHGPVRRFSFMPELVYFSADQENFIRSRVEMLNGRRSGVQVQLPERRFTSTLEYNRHFEQFKQGQRRWDLFIADVYRLRELVEKDLIWPLDEFVSPEWREQFLPLALDQCTIDNRLVAIPHWINVGVMIYRPDLLARHRLEPPRSWNELVEHSKIIMGAENRDNFSGFLYQGAPSEALTINFLEFLWNNGGDVFDQPLHIAINSSKAREALTFMKDLVHKHRIAAPDTPDLSEAETARRFHAGQAAFLRGWPQILTMMPRRRGINAGQMDLTSLPTRDGKEPGQSVIGGFCFVIPRYVEDPESLMDFCRKFYSADAIPELAIRGWTCPPYLAAYENKDVLRHRPFYSQILELMKNGRARKNIPYYEALSELVQDEMSECLRGMKSPEEALDTVAADLHNRVYRQVRELRLQRVTEYINENLHEDLGRDRMAALCHLSPSYFSTLFAETMNRPFAKYVNEKRIDKARHLLETTELTIGEIAERVGFRDQGYFCNVFREETRMPPSRYRLDALSKVTHR